MLKEVLTNVVSSKPFQVTPKAIEEGTGELQHFFKFRFIELEENNSKHVQFRFWPGHLDADARNNVLDNSKSRKTHLGEKVDIFDFVLLGVTL